MKGTGSGTRRRGRALMSTRTMQSMKAIGKMISRMAKAKSPGLMDLYS